MVTNTHTTLRLFIAMIVLATGASLSLALAETGTDFPGKVLKVDLEKGKLTVKKEKGGTRFTFVVTNDTQYEGLTNLKDLKRGDRVTVNYVVTGSRYIAQKVISRKK